MTATALPGAAPAEERVGSESGLLARLVYRRSLLIVPALVFTAIGVIGPVVILIAYSLKLVGDDTDGSVLEFYDTVLTDPFYRDVFWRTLRLAGIVTVVTLLLAYPLAVAITRSTGWRRTLLLYVTITPLLTNIVVRTLGWFVLLSDRGMINTWLGWISPTLERKYLGTELGLSLSLVHIGLPLMVLPMLTSIESQDPTLREAALVHGAHPLVAWWRVTLPMVAPGIVAGCTLVFVLGMSSLITPSMLGRGRMYVVSTLLVQQIGTLKWGRAAALALVLFVAVLVVVIGLQRLAGRAVQRRKPVSAERALTPRPFSWALTFANRMPRPGVVVTWLRRLLLAGIVTYLLLPLVVVLKSSVSESKAIKAGFDGFTMKWYGDALDADRFLPSAYLSLRLAVLTVLIGLVLAFPASFAIARGNFPGRKSVLAFLMSPLLLPHAALAVGFVLFFIYIGTGPSFERLLFAHVLVSLPYLVRVLVSALESMDPALEEAASSAGASPLRVFKRVTLPMIKPGIFAAVLFGFLTSFDEATVGVLVAAPGTPTLPVKIFSDLQVQYTPVVAAISGLLILVVLLVILPLERWVGLMAPRDKDRHTGQAATDG